MQNRLLVRSTILFLLTICLAVALQDADIPKSSKDDSMLNTNTQPSVRKTRATTRRPGFFRTLFSVVFEQWNDTRNTFGTVNRLINDNFLPDNAPVTQPPSVADANVSTTATPYRISRAELLKIVRRNLGGLQRLYNIELDDALKESEKYRREFRKNASKEVSKFL